jgi:hypothetical protein
MTTSPIPNYGHLEDALYSRQTADARSHPRILTLPPIFGSRTLTLTLSRPTGEGRAIG